MMFRRPRVSRVSGVHCGRGVVAGTADVVGLRVTIPFSSIVNTGHVAEQDDRLLPVITRFCGPESLGDCTGYGTRRPEGCGRDHEARVP